MSISKTPPGGAHLYIQPSDSGVKKGRRLLNLRTASSQKNALMTACNWADLYALTQECGVLLNPVRRNNSKATMATGLDEWVSLELRPRQPTTYSHAQRLSPQAQNQVLDVNAPVLPFNDLPNP